MRHIIFVPIVILVFTGLLFAQRGGNVPDKIPSADMNFSLGRQFSPISSQWQNNVNVNFSGGELRKTLTQFANSQKLGFFLDRRIDPGTEVTFSASGITVEKVFQDIAKSLNCSFVNLGQSAYFVPKGEELRFFRVQLIVACQFPAYYQQAETISGGGNSRKTANIFKSIPLKTNKLDTPQEVLQKVAKNAGIRIENIEAVPHDLLDELDLPSLSCCEVFTLLLFGFDLTYTFSADSNSIRIEPIPGNLDEVTAKLSQKVDFPSGLTGPKNVEEANKSRNQDNFATKTSSGSGSDKQGKSSSTPLSKRRFTIEVKDQAANDLLNSFSNTLDFTLEIDSGINQATLNKRISFELKNATFDQLMKAVLDPINCKYKLSGKKIIISEK
ncbi:MAG: hypothetical protein ACRC2T_13785 [Thermoguttaceae bacterium]